MRLHQQFFLSYLLSCRRQGAVREVSCLIYKGYWGGRSNIGTAIPEFLRAEAGHVGTKLRSQQLIF